MQFSEANWSGSTLFAKIGHIVFSKRMVKNQIFMSLEGAGVQHVYHAFLLKYMSYIKRLSCWVKISADDILKYVSSFIFYLEIKNSLN